jgi:hypothetical protein
VNSIVARVGEHVLEVFMGIAFLRHGEGRAQLHRGRAQALQSRDIRARADTAGRDQRYMAF